MCFLKRIAESHIDLRLPRCGSFRQKRARISAGSILLSKGESSFPTSSWYASQIFLHSRKAETCVFWRVLIFFLGTGVLEMQFIPLHIITTFSLIATMGSIHPEMAARLQGMPNTEQKVHQICYCHLFACWGYELSPDNFSSRKPFSSLCCQHLDPPFPPCHQTAAQFEGLGWQVSKCPGVPIDADKPALLAEPPPHASRGCGRKICS